MAEDLSRRVSRGIAERMAKFQQTARLDSDDVLPQPAQPRNTTTTTPKWQSRLTLDSRSALDHKNSTLRRPSVNKTTQLLGSEATPVMASDSNLTFNSSSSTKVARRGYEKSISLPDESVPTTTSNSGKASKLLGTAVAPESLASSNSKASKLLGMSNASDSPARKTPVRHSTLGGQKSKVNQDISNPLTYSANLRKTSPSGITTVNRSGSRSSESTNEPGAGFSTMSSTSSASEMPYLDDDPASPSRSRVRAKSIDKGDAKNSDGSEHRGIVQRDGQRARPRQVDGSLSRSSSNEESEGREGSAGGARRLGLQVQHKSGTSAISGSFSIVKPKGLNELMKKLYANEEVLVHSENCKLQFMHSDNSSAFPSAGKLLVTNLRLLFSSTVKMDESPVLEIPHQLVYDAKEYFIPGAEASKFLVVYLKDLRAISLRLDGEENQRMLKTVISQQSQSKDLKDLLVSHSKAPARISPFSFSLSQELQRQGLRGEQNGWVLADVNDKFDISPEGPKQLVLPTGLAKLEHEKLKRLAKLYSGRLPTYTWSNWDKASAFYGAVLLRSWRQRLASSVKVGNLDMAAEKTSDLDAFEALFSSINLNPKDDDLETHPRLLKVFDTASEAPDLAQQFSGYAEFTFLDLSDMAIRTSFAEIKSFALSRAENLENNAFSVLSLSFFGLVSKYISTAVTIAQHLLNGESVMLQCGMQFYETDGILATLVQLLCDPYYRTLKGFCTLIEKEWIHYGYAFTRDNECTGFFFMFYVVWTLLQNYPQKFEFNEACLVTILDDLFQKRTRTFAIDHPINRDASSGYEGYISIFEEILVNKNQFTNSLFEKADPKIRPYFLPSNYVVPLWTSLLLRNNKVVYVQHRKVRKEVEETDAVSKNQEKTPMSIQGLYYLDMIPLLTGFRQLALEKSFISHVSLNMAALTQLTYLSLDGNKLQTLSPSLGALSNLRFLSARSNNITSVSAALSRCHQLRELFLDNNHLRDFPRNFLLPNLETLSVRNNQLRHLPILLPKMTSLVMISLEGNQIQYFTADAAKNLSRLKSLDLQSNNLSQLPDLSGLVSLAHLNVANNMLNELPASIGKCTNLGLLNVSNNRLLRLPDTLSNCRLLQSLHANHNELQTLPASLMKCTRLMHIFMDHNHLTKFPECLRTCPVRQLSLAENHITEISPMIARLHLNNLNLRKNKITVLPSYMSALKVKCNVQIDLDEVEYPSRRITSQGIDTTLNYLAYTQKGTQPTYRIKLVVVGDPHVGKSSLAKAVAKKWIKRDDSPDLSSSSDAGLVISNYAYPLGGKTNILTNLKGRKKDNRTSLISSTIMSKAGFKDPQQDYVQNASNSFMSSSSAVFLLVFNVTDENFEKRIVYWMHSIKALGHKPSVILVGTHLDDESVKKKELQTRVETMAEQLGTIFSKGFSKISWYLVANSSKSTDGLDNLRQGINDFILTHDKMGRELPVAYEHFESILRAFRAELDVPVIDHKTLIQLGVACGLEDDKAVLRAASVLHDYGTIFHFSADARLANVVLLDPQWLARALSALYNSQSRSKFGLLQHNTLETVWPTYSAEMRQTLLYLCEKFEIAFSLKLEDYESLRALRQRSQNLLQIIHGMSKRSIKYKLDQADEDLKDDDSEVPLSPVASKEVDEAISSGLSLVPALLTPERPTNRILTFLDANFDALFEYHRRYKFSFIPNGMITRLLIRALQLVDVTLALWARGLLGTANGGVTVLVERVGEEDEMSLAKSSTKVQNDLALNLSNILVLKVSGREEEPTVRLFTDFVDIIDSIAADWKIEWESSVEAKHGSKTLIDISAIEDAIAHGKKVVANNKEIDPADLAPDMALKLYKGLRIPYDQIQIIKPLGSGGYAEVFRAKWDNKEVAVKQLTVNKDGRGAVDKRAKLKAFREYRHEILVQGELAGHKNLTELYGVCYNPLAMVIEFIPHGDVQRLAGDLTQDLSFKYALRLLADITRGIAAMHEKNYIHRDLKSPNVMIASLDVNAAVCAKIIDFGSAAKLSTDSNLTKGRIVDNPIWLSPEILSNQPYGKPSDIYAIGMIAWELIVRSQPFDGVRMWSEIEEQVIAGERPKLPPYCPPQFANIITQCWAGDPAQRPDATATLALIDTAMKNVALMEAEYGAKARAALQERRAQLEREQEEARRREEELQRAREIEAAKKLSGEAVPEDGVNNPDFAAFLSTVESKAAQKSHEGPMAKSHDKRNSDPDAIKRLTTAVGDEEDLDDMEREFLASLSRQQGRATAISHSKSQLTRPPQIEVSPVAPAKAEKAPVSPATNKREKDEKKSKKEEKEKEKREREKEREREKSIDKNSRSADDRREKKKISKEPTRRGNDDDDDRKLSSASSPKMARDKSTSDVRDSDRKDDKDKKEEKKEEKKELKWMV